MKRESRHYLLAGLGLIAAINLIALGGAWYNRSGEADSQLLLSQRELSPINLGWRAQNSGMRLQLNWMQPRADGGDRRGQAELSPAQMLQLGYSGVPCQPHCPRQIPRTALLVLELDGPLYRQQIEHQRQRLADAEQAQAALPNEASLEWRAKQARDSLRQLEQGSRLYLADVGLDHYSLRQSYPDRQRYAILAGWVRPYYAQQGLSGSITPLIQSINVPHPWSTVVRQAQLAKAQYRVELSFGKRLEPWITAVWPSER